MTCRKKPGDNLIRFKYINFYIFGNCKSRTKRNITIGAPNGSDGKEETSDNTQAMKYGKATIVESLWWHGNELTSKIKRINSNKEFRSVEFIDNIYCELIIGFNLKLLFLITNFLNAKTIVSRFAI